MILESIVVGSVVRPPIWLLVVFYGAFVAGFCGAFYFGYRLTCVVHQLLGPVGGVSAGAVTLVSLWAVEDTAFVLGYAVLLFAVVTEFTIRSRPDPGGNETP